MRSHCPRRSLTAAVALMALALSSLSPHIVSAREVSVTSRQHPRSALPAREGGDALILSSDPSGYLVRLAPPAPMVTDRTQGGVCTRVQVADYASVGEPGHPDLPGKLLTFGIPVDAEVSVVAISSETREFSATTPICPVVTPNSIGAALPVDLPVTDQARFLYVRDREAYESTVLQPEAIVEIVGTGYVRSQRIVQILVTPVQYASATGQLVYHGDVRFTLQIARGNTAIAGAPSPHQIDPIFAPDEGTFEPVLSAILTNYEDARRWRSPRAEGPEQEAVSALAAPTPQYRVSVTESGMHEITYDDLVAARVDPSGLDPRKLHLTNLGTEVAVHVVGGDDGSFGPSDSLRFYAEQIDSIYTDTNVYWLYWDDADGLRMALVGQPPEPGDSGTPHHVVVQHLEEDRIYLKEDPSNGDRWHWDYAYWMNLQTRESTITATIHHPATAPQTATLRGLVNGFYDQVDDHAVEILLNDQTLGVDAWSAQDVHSFVRSFPASWLTMNDTVTVTLRIATEPAISDFVWLNWVELEYGSHFTAAAGELGFTVAETGTYTVTGFMTESVWMYNITDPRAPVMVTTTVGYDPGLSEYYVSFGHSSGQVTDYLAIEESRFQTTDAIELDQASNLAATSNKADYLVISHGDFVTAVQPLVDHHTSRGLNVMVADVQDVYDEFGYGIVGAQPIRNFVQHAYESWTLPPPSYVLLVGDGNHDPTHNFGLTETSYIPPYLADVDPWLGEVPADNEYVAVSGDDAIPDLHLGRLPVKSAAETTGVVNKILAYEQNPAVADWNRDLVFVAGLADDSAGNFHYHSDAVANNPALDVYEVEKVHLGTAAHPQAADVRAALLAALDEGGLVVNYVGHGNVWKWGTNEGDFLRSRDVAGLTNAGRLPLMLPMTCEEGYYIHPSSSTSDLSSLGESLVRFPYGGAIASWSPTGYGMTSEHDFLDQGIFEAIFEEDIVELGPAATYAKQYLAASLRMDHYLLDTYLLFGDPAMRLKVLPVDLQIEKTTVGDQYAFEGGDPITYTLTYTNAGPATAHRVTISDTLPAAIVSPSWSASGAVITQQVASQYEWDVQDLPAGTGGVITISGRINGSFTGTITNAAEIATTSVVSDPATTVDEMVITVDPGITDVRITSLDLHLEPGRSLPALPGDPVTVTLTYDNLSPGTAHDVVLTGTLPTQLTNTAVTVTGATATLRPGSMYVWDVEDLVDGAAGTITFTGVVSKSLYTGPMTTTAEIATSSTEASVANNWMELVTAASARLIYMPIIAKAGP